MKKIKLLTSLSALSALGSGVALTAIGCSNNNNEDVVETDNYVQTNSDKFYIANDFDPNIFCGDTATISFVSPTKTETGIQRTVNKTDIKRITIKSIKSTVTNLKDKFLNGFTSISSIDLSALSSILNFGTQFIYNCDNLTEINIGSISKDRIPHDTNSFATENKDAVCYTNGIKLIYPEDDIEWVRWVWTNLIDHNSTTTPYRKINANFNGMEFENQKYILEDNIDPNKFIACSQMPSLDFDWKTTQYSVKGGTPVTIKYENDRSSLTQVILTHPDTNVKSIENCLLHECTNLTKLEIGTLPQLTEIGRNFLVNCSSLKQFNLSCLASVIKEGGELLYGCSSLTSIDLTPMTNITDIGPSFLAGCTNLKRIDLFDKSPKDITTDPYDFMDDVPSDCYLYCKQEYQADYLITSPWSKRSSNIKVRGS
ncbi:MAG: leucine-rich repeat protein, partial [Malacoplasma sp.]|nr:leucine-rich repeat protein [Malacoplasma sp.]